MTPLAIDPLLPYPSFYKPYIACTFTSELPPKVEGVGAGFGGWMVDEGPVAREG